MNPKTGADKGEGAQNGRTALLILDMINGFDFEGADKLMPKASAAADAILALRADVEKAGYPVVFVNDNFGEWHSERSKLVERALDVPNEVTRKLQPLEDDYFVIKPQFSGFYATGLQVLLPKLGVSRLILTGIATDICVLFTAADAHMRDYALWVPEDCVAAESDQRGRWALDIMRKSMNADIGPSSGEALHMWLSRSEAGDA